MTTTHRRIRSSALATLALTAGLLGSACSNGGPETIAATDPTPIEATVTAPIETATSSSTSATPQPADEPALVLRADRALTVHEAPDATSSARTLGATNEFGSALALLVLDDPDDGWVEVLLPGRPTGATGWVPLEAPGVTLRAVTTRLEVDLTARTLTLYEDDEVVLTTPVAIGSPDAPTPTGRFSITDKLQDPNPDGAYGPFALGLSGRSEVITDFAGGDGQIGIHGTNDPASIGQDVSHGCVRVPNEVIVELNERLPLGTPVVVR